MRRIDELFLNYPFYGRRQMVRQLWREGVRAAPAPERDLVGSVGGQQFRGRDAKPPPLFDKALEQAEPRRGHRLAALKALAGPGHQLLRLPCPANAGFGIPPGAVTWWRGTPGSLC